MTRPAVVLDCDPGVDDAIAILTAARYANVVAITTVNGNVAVDKTTCNALRVAQLAELDAPVHGGAATPLVAAPHDAAHVHADDGLANVELPPPCHDRASTDAVGFLLDITRQRDDIHLVASGPLTNLALAARTDPEFVHRLASLTIMGGGVGVGNVTAAAEFNIWADPEAAAIVFGAGAMHDPCAVLAVTHPQLFGFVARRVDIELTGTHTRGMTVVDERPSSKAPANAAVAYTVDAHAALQLILDAAVEPR